MGSDHPHRALAEKLAQNVATTWGRDEEFRDEAVSAILAAFDDVTGPLDKFKSDTAQALTETKVLLHEVLSSITAEQARAEAAEAECTRLRQELQTWQESAQYDE